MIGTLVRWMRPVFAPLLKLRTEPPELPETGTQVRRLRAATAYLSYRYLLTVLVWLPALLATLGVALGFARGGTVPQVLGALALLGVLGLVTFSLVAARLDWELRHYLVGERSLRVRQGAWVQQEVTLSYANIQNVEVTQGPLERWFGFSNVKVTTAGAASPNPHHGTPGLAHGVTLVGLTHAASIRELLLDALRRQRGSGLGDPDERSGLAPSPREVDASTPVTGAEATLSEVLEAARALRQAAEQRAGEPRGG